MSKESSELSREQIEVLLDHIDALSRVLVRANQSLLDKMAQIPDLPQPARERLVEWSAFVNGVLTESNEVVAGIKNPSSNKLN